MIPARRESRPSASGASGNAGYFAAYGLRIQSEVALPHFAAAEPGETDVVVRLGAVPRALAVAEFGQAALGGRARRFSVPRRGEFALQGHRRPRNHGGARRRRRRRPGGDLSHGLGLDRAAAAARPDHAACERGLHAAAARSCSWADRAPANRLWPRRSRFGATKCSRTTSSLCPPFLRGRRGRRPAIRTCACGPTPSIVWVFRPKRGAGRGTESTSTCCRRTGSPSGRKRSGPLTCCRTGNTESLELGRATSAAAVRILWRHTHRRRYVDGFGNREDAFPRPCAFHARRARDALDAARRRRVARRFDRTSGTRPRQTSRSESVGSLRPRR